MTKTNFESRQLPLPVLTSIQGGGEGSSEPKRVSEKPVDAELSSWPATTPSEADRAIFESIAANYFRSCAGSK